jgi:hypothetical protein
MGLSIAEFDVSITPSFSKAGKTASSSAAIRNVVKMAIASKNSEIKRQQKDLGRGRSFQGMLNRTYNSYFSNLCQNIAGMTLCMVLFFSNDLLRRACVAVSQRQ